MRKTPMEHRSEIIAFVMVAAGHLVHKTAAGWRPMGRRFGVAGAAEAS